jgi:hypothetical protein
VQHVFSATYFLLQEELNEILFNECTWGGLQLQIGFSHDEDAASTDFVGTRRAGIVDGPATIVEGKRVNIYVWYDNEFGYSAQVIRLVQLIAGITFPKYPAASSSSSSGVLSPPSSPIYSPWAASGAGAAGAAAGGAAGAADDDGVIGAAVGAAGDGDGASGAGAVRSSASVGVSMLE